MASGRTGYSNGRGEPGLVAALAARYTARRGRPIGPDQIMCLPGTQTVLYAILRTLVETGDEVLIGDPMYATYEGLIAQTGATAVPSDPAPRKRVPDAGRRCRRPDHPPVARVVPEHAAQPDRRRPATRGYPRAWRTGAQA
jgi:aspartate/methionine/tyrosine aminotransferase